MRSVTALHPYQFRLRSWFLWVVVFACACRLLIGAAGYVVWSVIAMALIVIVHMVATALGHSLRRDAISPGENRVLPAGELAAAEEFSRRATNMRLRRVQGIAARVWFIVAAGGVIGGVAGGIFVLLLGLANTGAYGLAVGTLSAAVLGGFLAFLCTTFIRVVRGALAEATIEHPLPDPAADSLSA